MHKLATHKGKFTEAKILQESICPAALKNRRMLCTLCGVVNASKWSRKMILARWIGAQWVQTLSWIYYKKIRAKLALLSLFVATAWSLWYQRNKSHL